jgi:hypothetical protein
VNAAPGPAPSRLADLFASAVHRYGTVWADLLVASLGILLLATLPVVAVELAGSRATVVGTVSILSYAIAYFAFVAFVMLRGLPGRAPAGRVVATYATAVVTGILAAAILKVLATFIVVVLPFLLFAVPSVAAGDVGPLPAIPRGILLALRNFARTYAVWLITLVFSLPVLISMFLVVSAFAGGGKAVLFAVVLAVPVIWPFSALFVRALYGDLTGRVVVAPQDRSL